MFPHVRRVVNFLGWFVLQELFGFVYVVEGAAAVVGAVAAEEAEVCPFADGGCGSAHEDSDGLRVSQLHGSTIRVVD